MTDSRNDDWWRLLLHPQDEAGKRRAALLQAAFDTVAEVGFEGLRTRTVASRAGVNIATLHYYFPSKQELIEGVAQLLSAKFVTLHGPLPKPSGLPCLDRLRQEFSDGGFYLKHHPEILLVMQEFGLRGKRDPEVKEIFEQMNGHWRQGIAQMVEEGLKDGTFRQDIPAQELTPLLMSILSGIVASGASRIDIIERNTEMWILSEKAKRKIGKAKGGKR
jgi:TetR/AcrR family transcriptional regulator, regulator of cefoperazone and chloramphenicol sensitivity